jgi:hypothetical protein
VCSELAAGLSGPPQTGESGSLLNWRQHIAETNASFIVRMADCRAEHNVIKRTYQIRESETVSMAGPYPDRQAGPIGVLTWRRPTLPDRSGSAALHGGCSAPAPANEIERGSRIQQRVTG